MRQFFESDLFKNLTSLLSLAVSIAAFVFSALSYSNAVDAKQIQMDSALHQGDYLQLYRGYVRVLQPGTSSWQSYGAFDDKSTVNIPEEVWRSATSRGVTFRMNNEGQQDAAFRSIYFPIKDTQGVPVRSVRALDVKCAPDGPDSWAECPTALKPHDGYSVAATIPDDLPAQMTKEQREHGLEVCAATRTGRSVCINLGVALPAQ